MSNIEDLKDAPVNLLFHSMSDVRDVMIGAEGAGIHMQPMAPQPDEATKTIWFFTRTDSDLALAAVASTPSTVCLITKDRDVHACLNGTLSVRKDREMIDKYWSSIVGAWFPEGKDDPALTMLVFKPRDAAIWASSSSAVKFGWEIAKANLTGEEPSLGHHKVITF